MCLAAVMSSLGPCPSSLLSVLTAPVRLRRQLSTSPLSMSSASPHTVTRMSAPLTGRSQPGSPSPVRHPADSSPCAAAAAPPSPPSPPPPRRRRSSNSSSHSLRTEAGARARHWQTPARSSSNITARLLRVR